MNNVSIPFGNARTMEPIHPEAMTPEQLEHIKTVMEDPEFSFFVMCFNHARLIGPFAVGYYMGDKFRIELIRADGRVAAFSEVLNASLN